MPLMLSKNIKKAFRRTASHIALFAGMGAGLLGYEAKAQISSPAPILQNITEPARPITEKDSLYIEFSTTQLGRDMLAFAKKYNVNILYDSKLRQEQNVGVYTFATKSVAVDPNLTMTDQIITLAHELRHAWQDAFIELNAISPILMTPEQRWSLARYCEADAYAFSSYFLIDRLFEAEKSIDAPYGERETTIAFLLATETNSSDGLTLAEYRKIAFEYFIAELSTYSAYKNTHLDWCDRAADHYEKMIRNVKKDLTEFNETAAKNKLFHLSWNVDVLPMNMRFEEALRRFGGISLDPAAPTSLQDKEVTVKTLLEDYPFRHRNTAANECFVEDIRNSFARNTQRHIKIREELKSLNTELLKKSMEHTVNRMKLATSKKP